MYSVNHLFTFNSAFQLAGDEGSGDRNRTFVFEEEGHTLGNVLKSIISR